MKYSIDLGLDAAVGVERGGFPMTAGLVGITESTGEGSPQWFTKLQPGDQVAFRVWDVTAKILPVRLVAFRATWVHPSRYDELSSPLRGDNPIVFAGDDIREVDASTAKSSVFTPSRGGWVFGSGEPALGSLFEITEPQSSTGRYYLRVRIDAVIGDPATIRTYHWDPEIVVDGSGGGGGG